MSLEKRSHRVETKREFGKEKFKKGKKTSIAYVLANDPDFEC